MADFILRHKKFPEALQAKNTRVPLESDKASHSKKLLSASVYVMAFTLTSYLA